MVALELVGQRGEVVLEYLHHFRVGPFLRAEDPSRTLGADQGILYITEHFEWRQPRLCRCLDRSDPADLRAAKTDVETLAIVASGAPRAGRKSCYLKAQHQLDSCVVYRGRRRSWISPAPWGS